jgi:DDE superfamily endonuclease
MQRLLSQAVWDSDGVRDDLRPYILEQLGEEAAILVIDETSFPKRGQHSAGVGWQYCGTTGQVENCQVGVFLSYVTPRGHSLIDRELYLPLDWCEDRDRCRAASIPELVRFQTKPELARAMIERIWKEKIPISWVVADTVYGGNLDLRTWLEASLPRKEPLCQRWLRPLAPDGMLRKILKTAKISAWTTTKCVASLAGTGTLRSYCWLSLILQGFAQRSVSPLFILQPLCLLPDLLRLP